MQVIEEASGEVLYTTRSTGGRFQPKVYSKGKHTVKIGRELPNGKTLKGVQPKTKTAAGQARVKV